MATYKKISEIEEYTTKIVDSFIAIKKKQLTKILFKKKNEIDIEIPKESNLENLDKYKRMSIALDLVGEIYRCKYPFRYKNDIYYSTNVWRKAFKIGEVDNKYFDIVEAVIMLSDAIDIKKIFAISPKELDLFYEKENELRKMKILYARYSERVLLTDTINNDTANKEYTAFVMIDRNNLSKYQEFNLICKFNYMMINDGKLIIRKSIQELEDTVANE